MRSNRLKLILLQNTNLSRTKSRTNKIVLDKSFLACKINKNEKTTYNPTKTPQNPKK